MATELICNEITTEYEPVSMEYHTIVSADTREFFYTHFDCVGIIELIVDASASEEPVTLSITTNVMSDPAQNHITYEVGAGEVSLFGISSGKTGQSDGSLWFSIISESALTGLGIKLGAIKRRFVTAH